MVYDVRQIATLRELIETSALDHASRTAFVLKFITPSLPIARKRWKKNMECNNSPLRNASIMRS